MLRPVGDKFPNTQVLGVDLSPIQPSLVPENVRFVVDDCEAEWVNGSGWDFAHFRQTALFLTDVETMLPLPFE